MIDRTRRLAIELYIEKYYIEPPVIEEKEACSGAEVFGVPETDAVVFHSMELPKETPLSYAEMAPNETPMPYADMAPNEAAKPHADMAPKETLESYANMAPNEAPMPHVDSMPFPPMTPSNARKAPSGSGLFRIGAPRTSRRKLEDLVNQLDETFSQKLLRLIRERDLKESDVYKKALVDRRHFSKIKKDDFYTPNKKTVLAFAIALELSLDETKDLLGCAGYALSRSSKSDVIIEYFLENQIYDIFQINDALYEFEQPIFEG